MRTTIDTARGILNGVNFGPLSNERKKAYNDAKLFLQQAEDALKQGNLAFAQGVATKAETLAKELAGGKYLEIGHLEEHSAKCPHLAPALRKAHNMWWITA